MSQKQLASLAAALIAAAIAAPAWSQYAAPPTAPAQAPAQPAAPAAPPAAAQAPAQPAPPPFATRKVDGTDNVYIFRYGGHQAMFVVTKAGVIATDPIGLNRPQAVTTYIDEIRKITQAPIKYVIYSHHHFDHIAGGKPFKDQGAIFIAHPRAKEHLAATKHAAVVIPDQVVIGKKTIKLGDTTLELHDVGRNESDSALVMRLPKEKIIFAVDFIPIQTLLFRNMMNGYIPDWEDSIKRVLALDWDRMIPGHPNAGGRFGTKDDARAVLAYMQELSAEVKKAADAGKCWDTAIKEVRLPKYATWANYEQYIGMNVERYCAYWGRGY